MQEPLEFETPRARRHLTPLRALVAIASLTACTRYVAVDRELGPQAYYQTAFPAHDVSASLESVLAAVVRIHVQSSYDHYLFAEDRAPVSSEVQADMLGTLLADAIDTIRANSTRAATAVIIAASDERITLITTAHAINFPVLMVEYYEADGLGTRPEAARERSVARISMKVGQTGASIGFEGVEPFDVLARDDTEDLALIGVRRVVERTSSFLPVPARPPEVPVLDPLTGDPRELSWGSFVYVVGNPGGYRMVTRGIVSEPNRSSEGAFIIDGLWNEGMSGAPILAIRGDTGEFEWVGVARAAAARTTHRFAPAQEAERTQDPLRPYVGPLYLQEHEEIRPGISFSIPLTTVRRFIDESRPLLVELGYPLPSP